MKQNNYFFQNEEDVYMKKRKKGSIIFVTLFLVIGIILIIYFLQKNRYKDLFYEGTIINGVDCSLLTVEQAEQFLHDKELQYILEIELKNNKKVKIKGTQIQLELKELDGELSELKEQQNRQLFFSGGEYTVSASSYSQEKLKKRLSKIKQLKPKYMKSESKIKYDSSSNCFERVDKYYYLDSEEVYATISKAIDDRKESVSLKELYKVPEKDTVLDNLNKIAKKKIVYEFPNGKQYVLDIDILKTWLIQDEEGYYKKDKNVWKEKIEEFVTQEIGPQVETVGMSRKFKPTGKDANITVSGGNYGYLIDKEGEIKQLTEDLSSDEKVKREPIYQKEEVSSGENDFGKSYVEIDLTRQKVWVYKDGKLQVETSCVTGCVSKGHETPTGIFTLTYKQEDRILRGQKLPNGNYEYQSHVNYWMPFNGGIGLHDATWRSSFGGNIYMNSGSHGCINLPLEAARSIYGIINYQMPIIVYKS